MMRIASRVVVHADEWSKRSLETIRLQRQVEQLQREVKKLTKEMADNRDYDFWTNARVAILHDLYRAVWETTAETFLQMEKAGKQPADHYHILNRFYLTMLRSAALTHEEYEKIKK